MIASSAAFATSGPVAKALLATGWTPTTLVTARVGIAGLVLLGPAIVASRGRWGVVRAEWRLIVGVALTGVAGCQIAYFNAVTHLQVSIALLIEYLGIVLVVLWLWLRTGRVPHRATVGGVALAVLGLVLVLDVSGASSPDLVGVLWASSSAIGLAAYFVIIARAHADLPSVTLAALGMLLGAGLMGALGLAGLLPWGSAGEPIVLAGRQVPWWWGVLSLSLIAAAFAYLLGAIGARRLGSTVASVVGLTEVLFAVFLAWALLDELPGAAQLVGGALVVAGVAAVRWGERADVGPVGDFPAPGGLA